MRTKIMSATLLVLGTSAGVVSASDNIALQGSDTLEEVTKDVLAACPAATAAAITYRGGGSTTGENAMSNGLQSVAPMSRFLNPTTGVCAKGSTAEGIAIGLDGLAIVANGTEGNACGGGLAFTPAHTIDVVDVGGNPVLNCEGCTPGTSSYALADFKDVLALVFAGKHHTGTYECNSPVRRSLVENWSKLFEATCTGSTCTALKHAFRRADLSGTTDTFLAQIGLSGMPLAKTVSGAVAKPIVFCNAYGTGTVFGGDSDYLDNDPIRRPCESTEQACGRDGTLGLVTVVEVPANLTISQNYPTTSCGVGKFRLLKPASSGVTTCPNGKGTLFGKCFQPVIENSDGSFTADCLARRSPVQGFGANGMDGRAYNLNAKDATGLYRKDNLGRFITGAFFRLQSTTTVAAGASTCQTGSATEQIGCFAQANPCTLGFAGREATQQAGAIGLTVKGIAPTQANIEKLVTTADPSDDYPLARKLFFSSIAGFENTTGGELELAKCMGNNSIVGPAISGRGFIPIPGGVFCQDFDESQCAGGSSNANACAGNPAGIPSN